MPQSGPCDYGRKIQTDTLPIWADRQLVDDVIGYCCAQGPTQGWPREAIMSEEHTDNLKKARAKLIEQRRAFVKVLAGP
jgi:hypothetical protein